MDTLRPEFSELKTVSADQLMYVKEDLILPHHYTFYDFIVTKVGSHLDGTRHGRGANVQYLQFSTSKSDVCNNVNCSRTPDMVINHYFFITSIISYEFVVNCKIF